MNDIDQKTVNQILARLDMFLYSRYKGEDKLGTPVWKDVEELKDIIDLIITAKWGEDIDGYAPVEFSINDLTKFEAMPYIPKVLKRFIPKDDISEEEISKKQLEHATSLFKAAELMTSQAADYLKRANHYNPIKEIRKKWAEQSQ